MATQAEISQVVKGWRVSETRSFDGSTSGAFMQSLRTGFKKRGWHLAAKADGGRVVVKRLMINPRAPK